MILEIVATVMKPTPRTPRAMPKSAITCPFLKAVAGATALQSASREMLPWLLRYGRRRLPLHARPCSERGIGKWFQFRPARAGVGGWGGIGAVHGSRELRKLLVEKAQ